MTEAVFVAIITAGSAIVVAVIGLITELIKHKTEKAKDRKNHRGRPSKR